MFSFRCLVVFGVAWLLAAGLAADDKSVDVKKLEGRWRVKSATLDGKAIGNMKDGQIAISADKMTIVYNSGKDQKFTFALDTAAKPKAMELAFQDVPNLSAPSVIYELDGDTLKLVVGEPGMRPKEFTDKGHPLVTLEREKATAAEPLTAARLQEREKAATAALAGTWELHKTFVDGKEQENAFEYRRWRVDGRALRSEYKTRDGREYAGDLTVTVNPTADPPELNVHNKETLLLAVYRQDGDRLTVAILGRSEVERPRGFDPKDKRVRDVPLTVWEFRRRESGTPPIPTARGGGGVYSRAELAARGEVVKGQTPVFGYWENHGEVFSYAGEAAEFNRFVAAYAKTEHATLRVVVHAGAKKAYMPWDKEDRGVPADWSLYRWKAEKLKAGEPLPTQVDVWLGSRITLGELKIPDNVEVVSGGEIEAFVKDRQKK